jgi:DNA-binding transcriptional LysR family regulator
LDLDAKPLQYFAAVARENSFSRAAAKLHVSQPSLSAQIRELERRLGFALFNRSSRRIELTREGRFFLPQALQMIAEAARMNRVAREIRDNALHIAAAIYTVLIPERVALIDAFARAHPQIALMVTNFDQGRAFVELRRGDIDLAVVIGLAEAPEMRGVPPSGAPSEIVLPPDVERLSLLRKPVELLVPHENALAKFERIPQSALRGVRVISLGDYHGTPLIDAVAGPLEAAGAELIVPPEGNAIAVERYGQAMRCPAVSIGWFHYGDQPETQDMVRRPVESLDVEIELAVIRPRSGAHRPAADLFWAWAEQRR